MKKFKLWIEGEPLQEEVWDRELNAPKTVDILFDEEPRKATNELMSLINIPMPFAKEEICEMLFLAVRLFLIVMLTP